MAKKNKKPISKLGDVQEANCRDLGLPNPPQAPIIENRKKSTAAQLGEYYKNLFKSEYIGEAERLIAAGFSEKDLAYTFDVPHRAIVSWKANNPAFKAACEEGKRREKKRLVAKALLSAVGYDYETSMRETQRDAEGNVKKTTEKLFKQHQPSNHNLLMFLLCNIDHQLGDDEWHSKHKFEIDENKNIKVTINGEVASEQIAKLAGEILKDE